MNKYVPHIKSTLRYLKRELGSKEYTRIDLNSLIAEGYYNIQIEEQVGQPCRVKGELRRLVLQILLTTLGEWKIELDKLNQDYYLAIWIREPWILTSEVVCAIGDTIAYYENNCFIDHKNLNHLDYRKYGSAANELERLVWTRKYDERSYDETAINWPRNLYSSDKVYFYNQRIYRKILAKEFHVEATNKGLVYYYPIGDVWVGKFNSNAL